MTDSAPLSDDSASRRRGAVADAARYAARWFAFIGEQRAVPGIQAAIRQDGELVLDFAWGFADQAAGTPLTGDHLFRIASHSKTFTATAVLQLAERGALRLDDTVSVWIPELADTELSAVTVRELLAHQGGVVRDGRDADYWQRGGSFPDRSRLLAICRDDGRVFARNEFFKYSNIAYGMLGLIVEAASGLDYDRFTRENICAPLGLERSGSEWQSARADEYAAGHTARLAGGERRGDPPPAPPAAPAAPGWVFDPAGEDRPNPPPPPPRAPAPRRRPQRGGAPTPTPPRRGRRRAGDRVGPRGTPRRSRGRARAAASCRSRPTSTGCAAVIRRAAARSASAVRDTVGRRAPWTRGF